MDKVFGLAKYTHGERERERQTEMPKSAEGIITIYNKGTKCALTAMGEKFGCEYTNFWNHNWISIARLGKQ